MSNLWHKVLHCVISVSYTHLKVVYAEDLKLAPNAASSVLMEASTKQVLYSSHETDKLFPASTTKIMTMILMFEAINKGTLKWDDVLTCSAYAASMGGSQIYLEAVSYTHLDVYKRQDLDMLKVSGLSVAAGNAIDDIKAVCDYTTQANHNEGVVAELIEKFILE